MNLKSLSNQELSQIKDDIEKEIRERIAALSQILKRRGRHVDGENKKVSKTGT